MDHHPDNATSASFLVKAGEPVQILPYNTKRHAFTVSNSGANDVLISPLNGFLNSGYRLLPSTTTGSNVSFTGRDFRGFVNGPVVAFSALGSSVIVIDDVCGCEEEH